MSESDIVKNTSRVGTTGAELNGFAMTNPIPGSSKTIIARWDLDLALLGESEVPDMKWYPPAGHESEETVIGADGRRLVNPKDYASGGKYRCTLRF